jgi:hypothetical protein
MSNPAISRAQVHELADACGNNPDAFNPTATRLIKEQRRLTRFFEQNAEALGPVAAQVAMYMLTVSIRVIEQSGGKLRKVSGADIDAATAKVQAAAASLMPADGTLHERARAIADRAQPHLLDEVLWALYERAGEEKKEGEMDVDPEKSALIYLMLWTAIEALDLVWAAPASLSSQPA